MEGKNERLPYAEEVKKAVTDSLENGTSVLLKDRSGIDYSQNAVNGNVYTGINQFHLQQFRENNGFKNPFFQSAQQTHDKNMGIMKDSHGVLVSYWADPKRYKDDVYGDDGKVSHKKGEVKMQADGKTPEKGREYTFVFNLDQIDTRQHLYDKDSGRVKAVETGAYVKNTEIKQQAPFPVESGAYYKAQDDSPIERFASDVSRYMNSIYTGAEYKAATYSKDDVEALKAEFANPRSRFFEKIDVASYVATGNIDKLEKLEKSKEAKAENANEASKGRSR